MSYQRGKSSNHQFRVVITGTGMITSLGCGISANADGFREGKSGLRPITLFDTSRQRAHRGGEVDLPSVNPPHKLSPRESARLNRASSLLIHAGAEAWLASGLDANALSGEVIPLVFGTSAGAMALGERFYEQCVASPERRRNLPSLSLYYQANQQARVLGMALGIQGPVTIIANACASGANAIGQAYRLVRTGRARRVVCGGYDALCQMVFAGFDSLQALSPTTPRPFDATRDGLALGEGAAVFVLERYEDATARGAPIDGEILGYGSATDIHHLTQPHPNGDAALASMRAACAEAKLNAEDIDYINSHGTGTPLNDSAEAAAIAHWAGSHTPHVPVSSTKAAIGHLLGGAGAVEAGICLLAMQGGWFPPTLGVKKPDPCVTFDLIREPRSARVDRTLTNSFGFGGANATLILGRICSALA